MDANHIVVENNLLGLPLYGRAGGQQKLSTVVKSM